MRMPGPPSLKQTKLIAPNPMYHTFIDPRIKRSTHEVESLGRQFCASRTLPDIARWLGMEKHQLQLLSAKPQYETFFIPKKSGGKRLIQHPTKRLKQVQKRLAFGLQCAYFPVRTDAAYGFLISPADEETARNIYTNACRHVGQAWLINLDLKDFFHQVNAQQIEDFLQVAPFDFTDEAASCLARLCTCNGRLPMGAPSSPILSNFACRSLDLALEALVKSHNMAYTRYADDLTFSADTRIAAETMRDIRACIEAHHFRINEKKLILQRREDRPEVTGLRLHKKRPDVSPAFIKGIKYDLKILRALTAPRMVEREIFVHPPVKKLRQSIQGQINFVKFIRGKHHPSCLRLQERLDGCGH